MTTPGVNARLAQAAIVAQVMDAVESAKAAAGLTARDMAARAELSKRTLVYLRKLQTAPTLQTLLAVVDAAGLELEIRVRRKRA
jgi:DNA-binding phage protein